MHLYNLGGTLIRGRRFTAVQYKARSGTGPSVRIESSGKAVDADIRAGPSPASISRKRHVVGVDWVEDAVRTAVRRREAGQRWSLRQQRPLERTIHLATGAWPFIADDDVGDALVSKAVERRQLEVLAGQLMNGVLRLEAAVEEGRNLENRRAVAVRAAVGHCLGMGRPRHVGHRGPAAVGRV